jgi:GT2 family glycosyltransferase
MIFISVVSHGHADLIKRLGTLDSLKDIFTIVVTDNIGEESLENYCKKNNVYYIKNSVCKGFGENNNQNYYFATQHLSMRDDDFFMIINPDVTVSSEALVAAQKEMYKSVSNIATINLVKDTGEYDANIRKFPKIYDFFFSYLFNKNRTILNKNNINSNVNVDWASGSFLIFKSSLFKLIGGFDERFYMYCEDLDICKRVYSKTGERVLYIPNIKACHLAAHNNRKIFSKHFYWHLKSVFRYCLLARY